MRATLVAVVADGRGARGWRGRIRADADRHDGHDPKLEVKHRRRRSSRSRCRWSSSATDDFFVLEKSTGSSSGSRTASRRRCSTWRSTRTPSAACWASRCDRTSVQRLGLPVLDREHDRRRQHGRRHVPLLGNRLDRFHWNGTTLTLEKTCIAAAAAGQRTNRTTRRPRSSAATTTAASCGSGPDGKIYLIIGDTGRRGQTAEPVRRPVRVPAGTGPRTWLDRRRPVRRPGHRRRAPDRRDPAAEHRRHRARGQPVLQARRRAGRPQRRGR